MKTIVTDSAACQVFLNRLNAWVKENTQGKISQWIDSAAVTECSSLDSFRITCVVVFENRQVQSFTRSSESSQSIPPTITKPEDVDAWSIDPVAAVDGKIELSASFSTAACTSCKGKGRLPCPECRGQKGLFCTECHGDGKIPCPICRKSRKVPCERCKGHGRVYNEANQGYELCPVCEGKGGSPCTSCVDGYVTCPKCGGKKQLPCARCHEQGDIECTACLGKGYLLSGLCVELSMRQERSSVSLADPDIPKELASSIPYETIAAIDDIDTTPTDLPADVAALLISCAAQPQAREGEKKKRSSATVERQRLHRLAWGRGAESRSVVFADAQGKLTFEPGFISLVYAGMITDIKAAIVAGNIPAATALLSSASGNPILAGQLAPLAAATNKLNWTLAGIGGAAGALAGMAVTLPLVYHWRASSLHVAPLIIESMLFCIGAGALGSVLIALLCRNILSKKWQRLAAVCLSGILLSLAGYGMVRMAGIDPARTGDRQEAEASYKSYFPFGLRTLASNEDISFLEKLITTYEPTGIDLSSYKKDLGWLKDKLAADEINLKKIEQAGHELEEADRQKQEFKLHRYRKKPKIYIE